MAIAKLSIDIEARLANFERDLGKISTAAESTANRIKTSFAGVGAIVGSAFGALLAAGAVQQFQGLVNSLDQMAESAERIGLTTEALSGLAYAGKMSGLELDDMTLALTKLAGKMQDAASGSKEAKALFKDLGVNVKDASGNLKTADAIFAEVAEKFAGLEDGAAKTALAVDIFGKSGAKLVPLLNGGAQGLKDMTDEAARLGGILDGKLAKQAADFNDNLDKLATLSASAGKSLASDLLPWLNEVAESFLIATKHSDGFWDTLNKKIPGLQIVDVAAELGKVRSEFEQIDFRISNGRAKAGDAERLASLQKEIDYYTELAKVKTKEAPTVGNGKIVRTPSDDQKTPKAKKGAKDSAFSDYDAMLTERIAKAIESTDIVKANELAASLEKLDKLAAAGLDPALIKAVRDDLTGATKAAADEVKRLNDMLANTESSGIEKARSDMELLVKALNAGTISEQQYLEASTARLDLAAKKTEEVTSEMDEFAKSAAKNMQTSFADFLFDPFGDGTKSMASNFAKALQRMAADAASAKLMVALFGDGKDNKGAFSGVNWSRLFSGSGSSSSGATGLSTLPSSVLPSFAVGTDYVPKDMIAMIHKGERITPAKFNPANGGGSSVNIVVHNEAGGDGYQASATAKQNGSGIDINVLVTKAIQSDMKRNGPITQGFGQMFGMNRSAA